MTPALVEGSYAESLYERLAPVHEATDEANGFPFRAYIGGIGSMHELVHSVVADTDEHRGWSALYDPDRCPVQFLPWLAQHVGVRIPVGASEEVTREMIRRPAGFERCSVPAVIAAVQTTLTGTKYVNFIDRQDDSFWRWLIVTKPGETPRPDLTYLAALGQKRAGVILTHEVTDVTLIDELEGTFDELADDIDDL